MKKFNKHQVIIVEGETGSGKTTQIPQFIIEANPDWYIGVTQPRRVAAMSISQRVAQEMDVRWGDEVGYTIRFEDKTNEKTRIKYMTDGMLLREAMSDPLLQKYNCILLDEIHERTLNTDILLGLIKEILQKRPELKLVLMSATLNTSKFSDYFSEAPLLQVSGRQYPVDIVYTDTPQEDYLDAAIKCVINIHENQPEGDILLFLTGEEEIEIACQEIRDSIDYEKSQFQIEILPLYSSLPAQQQQEVFSKPQKGIRKCVIATNIAETSITIDGVVYVVDPGFSKQKVYNPRLGVESLLVSPISKASAKQRSGRAGRTKPGQCYRLYTEDSFKDELIDETYPEILRSSLANLIIQLKKIGVQDLVHFDFLDPPSPETLMRGLEELYFLGAINDEGQLTPVGQCISEIPLEPRLAKILLSSKKVMDEMLTLASMLSVPSVFVRPWDRQKFADQIKKKYSHPDSDHISLINVYNAYLFYGKKASWCKTNFINFRALQEAGKIRYQLFQILKRLDVYQPSTKDHTCSKYFDYIKKCKKFKLALLKGFFSQVAHLQKNRCYMTVKDQQVVLIHPSSIVEHRPAFILFNEFAITKKNYMRQCTRIDIKWQCQLFRLIEIQPEYTDTIKLFETKKEIERAKEPQKIKKNSQNKVINEMCIWKTQNEVSYFTVDASRSKYKL